MSKKLFTPGPSNVPQHIRVQLAKDITHHRMADFHNIFFKVTGQLKQLFNTKKYMLTFTSSGTGVMESAVVNLFSSGDEVLVINTGNFGDRFIEICNIYGLKTFHIDYEWGTTFDLNDVKEMLTKHENIKGVFVTYHETSTGVINHIESLGEYISSTQAILITDCISGMIAHPFDFDNWNVDCALAASQKGFGLPPGLSFVALSDKAMKRLSSSNLPKFYFDYQKYLDYYKKGETPYTPAIPLITAIDFALTEILDRGVADVVAEKKTLRLYLESKLIELGFELFIKNEINRGNVLVPVTKGIHQGLDIPKLVSFLDDRYNLQVSKGQGKYTNDMLRIGIISDFTTEDIDDLIEKIKEFIEKK